MKLDTLKAIILAHGATSVTLTLVKGTRLIVQGPQIAGSQCFLSQDSVTGKSVDAITDERAAEILAKCTANVGQFTAPLVMPERAPAPTFFSVAVDLVRAHGAAVTNGASLQA